MDLLLAIDQGTSGVKLSIFDLDGNVVACVTKGYETYYPQDNYVEQDAQEWWHKIVEGIQEMLADGQIEASDIKGIGIDGTSWACIPLSADGTVLYRTMIWLDRRAVKQANWLKDTIGEAELIGLSGNPVDAAYITPKMLWLKENEPEIYAKTHCFVQSNAFIGYRLTGQLAQDPSQGYGFHFYDVSKGCYNEEMASRMGISLEIVAPIKACHEVIGGVTEAVSALTGLVAGTPVVAGGLDAACCTLGAGVIFEGQTQEQGGQAGGMSIALNHPCIHPKLILGHHVVPDMWLLQGGTTGGGGTLNWFNREFGHYEKVLAQESGKNPFEILSQEAAAVPEGSEGVVFLPYMKGERSPLWNGQAKGVYYGLSFDKTRGHMIRSTMEGVAFSLKHNLDTAYEVGAKVDEMRSVGGSANSAVWTQLKADITGCPISVPFSDHATALGASILAGIGVGLYESFAQAVARTVKIQHAYTPNVESQSKYTGMYQQYLKLSQVMSEHFW